jgi:hypothetical protein
MTAKLLTPKSDNIYRSTFRALTREKEEDPKEKEKRCAFDKEVDDVLGPKMTSDDMSEDDTLIFDAYEDADDFPVMVPIAGLNFNCSTTGTCFLHSCT